MPAPKSNRTSTAGILAIVVLVAGVVTQYFTGMPLDEIVIDPNAPNMIIEQEGNPWPITISALLSLIISNSGHLFARDNNVSSEGSKLK